MQRILGFFVALVVVVSGFAPQKSLARARAGRLYENFGLEIAEDPYSNAPRRLVGEVNYKNFIQEYDPNGLLIRKYDIIDRVRELKLLKLTAESGLLEALEEKGVTLSQIEKYLPLVDELNLLPLVSKNKNTLLSLAPLLIEPAPALLPVVASVIKTPSSNFLLPGLALLGYGAFEIVDNSALVGILATLLGLPLAALGAILGGAVSVPAPTGRSSAAASAPVSAPFVGGSQPVAKGSRPAAPKAAAAPKAVAAPKVGPAPTVSASAVSGGSRLNGKRKTVRIR